MDSIHATGPNALLKSTPSYCTKPACNQSGLVLDDRTGFIFLQLEHPLEGDRAVAGWEIS
jgi:hypothetical protein